MVTLEQAQAAIRQVASTYEFYVLMLVVGLVALIAILGIFIYGMGPFKKLIFYKGALLLDVTPDNGVVFRKVSRLRKQMMIFYNKSGAAPFRAGLLTSYSTQGGPRLYLRYSPSEMAMQIRLLPWLKKAEVNMRQRWKYTPQNWEQLCVLFYKDYIDQHLNDADNPPSLTERIVLKDDKYLIEEIETNKLRPFHDENGVHIRDSNNKPLYHPPHTVEEREALLDRAESAMISDNPDDLGSDTVDIKDAVMFRRSTFTDNDLSDAFSEGFNKAKDTQGKDHTKILVWGIVIFMIFMGGAALMTTLKIF